MSIESGSDSGTPAKKQKSGRGWLRDVMFFLFGFGAGAGTTIGVGLATDTITAEDLPGGGARSSEETKPTAA
ncbi:hypothetical protein F0U59_26760 [Archangium gephyra]|nr:hypothetical protein F0U59_26760 [Archangium gephyra]